MLLKGHGRWRERQIHHEHHPQDVQTNSSLMQQIHMEAHEGTLATKVQAIRRSNELVGIQTRPAATAPEMPAPAAYGQYVAAYGRYVADALDNVLDAD